MHRSVPRVPGHRQGRSRGPTLRLRIGAGEALPAVLAGTALARLIHSRIGGSGLRIAVLVFAFVSGAALGL